MAENKGVLVFCEVNGGKLASITGELLGCGRKLADALGEKLSAVLAGSDVNTLAQEAVAFGADIVYVVDDQLFKDYQPDAYLSVTEKVAKQAMPQVVLFGQTAMGRDLAPRLAFRFNTVASMDCIDLAIDSDSKRLLQTKPVYGGNAQAIFMASSFPEVATLRAKVMSPLERTPSRQGEVIAVSADLDPSILKVKFLGKVAEKVQGIRLEDATIVVAGGRGIGGPDGFKQLEELAQLVKGAVGATRPPCDNGWVPAGLQVGLTGKIIAPDVYIAIAISGTSQHLSGCSGAKHIIAINKDPEANIFKVAQYGVVGDWKKVLPSFTQKVKDMLAG